MSDTQFTPEGTLQLNIGPQTFAGTAPQPIVAKSSNASADVGTGYTAGEIGTNRGTQVLAADKPQLPSFTDGLLTILKPMIQPAIEQAKRNAMYQGMVDEAAGKSIQQMQDEQSPLSKVFGDSDYVQGAQLAKSSSIVAGWESQTLDQMNQLRSMNSVDATKKVADWMQASLAGVDAGTAVMAQAQYMEKLPAFIQQHAKEHVAYLKQDFADSTTKAAVAALTTYNTLANSQGVGDGTVNSEQVNRALVGAQSVLEPQAGMTAADQAPITLSVYRDLQHKGAFQALEAIKKTKAWGMLSTDQQDALTAGDEAAFQKNAASNPAWRGDMAQSGAFFTALQQGATPFGSLDEVYKAMDAQNAKSHATLGHDLYNNEDYKRAAASWLAGQERLAAKSASARDTVADETAQANKVRANIQQGGIGDLTNVESAVRDKTTNAMWNDMQALTDPNAKAIQLNNMTSAMASSQGNLVPPVVKQTLNSGLTSFLSGAPGNDTQLAALHMAAQIAGTPSGAEALSQAVGADNAAQFMFMLHSGADLNNPEAVDNLRQVVSKSKGVRPTADQTADAAAYIKSNSGMLWNSGELSGLNLTDAAKGTIVADMTDNYARYSTAFPGMDKDQLLKLASSKVLQNGQVINGAYIRSSPFVSDQRTLQQVVSKANPNYSDAVIGAASAKAAERQFINRGLDIKDYEPTGGESIGGGAVILYYVPRDKWLRPDAKSYGESGFLRIQVTPSQVSANLAGAQKDYDRDTAVTRGIHAGIMSLFPTINPQGLLDTLK